MTLFLIGIGLWDAQDITVKGLAAIKKCSNVYLENYTSLLGVTQQALEELYQKNIILVDRAFVEQQNTVLEQAQQEDVALLIMGDVFSATTHYELFLEAKKRAITVEVIFNASIMTAISITGLMLYNFGKTTSIPFPQDGYHPETTYQVVKQNLQQGLHTLVLLDIQPKEKGYMTVNQGLQILLDLEKKLKKKVFTNITCCLGCARIGGNRIIKYGTVEQLLKENFGKPPHCIIIPGKLHFLEEEALEQWKI